MSSSESHKTIYVFRCGESGLFALTHDCYGENLPSTIYPRMRWQFDRIITLGGQRSATRQEVTKATLNAIRRRGFYLTHAATDFMEFLLASDLDQCTGCPRAITRANVATHLHRTVQL